MKKQADFQGASVYVFSRLERELSPYLTYHGVHHTRDDVLPAAQRLAQLSGLDKQETLLLSTAALYHDIGYIESYTNNEPLAVKIAWQTLPAFGYQKKQIQVVEETILATRIPQQPHNFLQELMCDADLDSLGRDDFFTTSHWLLQELRSRGEELTMSEWYSRQLIFMEAHRYFSPHAIMMRQEGKLHNMQMLKERLKTPEKYDIIK